MYLKAMFYWRFLISPFPNPHVRTNAFMVRRKDFIELSRGAMKRKFQAYLFESGRRSLSNKIIKKGLEIAVVGKNGKRYSPQQWKESNTFWIGEQENLLISDNQTELYDKAELYYKKYLSFIAWGVK